MMDSAGDLSARLAARAEDVCRRYLPNGRREGRYWIVGDVANTPGRSCYVRLRGPLAGPGAAGKWSDAATGEHGDLIDLIGASCGLRGFRAAAQEARCFLGLRREPSLAAAGGPTRYDSVAAARRLFAASEPVHGTLAEVYLRGRGITAPLPASTLRFHPSCWYGGRGAGAARSAGPALIAAVTDLTGQITGVHRTWLSAAGAKADFERPRRALGHLAGHGVRFGRLAEELAVAEGLENALSARSLWPHVPAVAALSAAHMACLVLPMGLRRLRIIQDNDPAGRRAAAQLSARAKDANVAVRLVQPQLSDLNDDLRFL